VTFRLRIPDQDDAQAVHDANPVNPLVDSASVSGLAELAASAVCDAVTTPLKISGLANLAGHERAGSMTRECAFSPHPSLRKYTQTIITLPPDVAAVVESERLVRRRSRISWMGYVEVADQLTELLAARDRRLDDRRLWGGGFWSYTQQKNEQPVSVLLSPAARSDGLK
jgi:hypothetical protein